ncbi:MAG: sulfatase-like hydrolase/transferase [Oceanicaulis sp.]|nr:sulfatase-like hydrolase/transferase [Oceanicaulis sp.]
MRTGHFGPRALAVIGVVLALGVSGWWAFDRYVIYLPGLVQDLRDPVGPNRPVQWAAGPDDALDRDGPPNIVLIVADDLGWNDITLHGGVAGGSVPTPNIDRLAREGVQLTNTYAASATCAPSRAALMTGRLPTRFGFEFTPMPPGMPFIVRRAQRRTPMDPPFLFHSADRRMPEFADMGLPASEIALPRMLGEAGYHSILIGKWHLGGSHGSDPVSHGFDESLELAGLLYAPAGDDSVVEARQDFDPIDAVYWAVGRAAVREGAGPRFAPDIYLTDYFTREAVRAIEANRNRPFFLYLAHWAPHSPLQAAREDYEALDHIEDHATRVYAAMITAFDRGVGEVLDALDAQGLADDTVVIFTSDNGGAHYIGVPGLNDPYRGWKATFFDGGIRVPTFMRWPGVIEPGSEMAGLAQHIDILPTLAAVAGAAPPRDRVIDGRDLTPFLTGEADGAPHETLFWRSGHYRAVIHQGWKLQVAQRPDQVWLFDLDADPGELVNLAQSEPGRAAALRALMDAHYAEQAEPLWPSIVEMPVNVDTPLGRPRNEDDEYVYWPN